MNTENHLIKNNNIFKQNREVSWLRFNERILEEADDVSIPILERLKFVSIYATNLDEFFMVRVGSLLDKSIYTPNAIDNKSGMDPKEQLDIIYEITHLLNDKYNNSYKGIEAVLRTNGISSLDYKELDGNEIKYVRSYFEDAIYPVLSPQIIDPHHPFPHLKNKSIYVACLLSHKDKKIYGIVPVPENIPEYIFLPGKYFRYIHVEKIIIEFIDDLFRTYQMEEKACISVTRNADITLEDDPLSENMDFRHQMKKLLHLRKRLAVVKLETNQKFGKDLTKYLCKQLDIEEYQIYLMSAPLEMHYVYDLVDDLTQIYNKNLLYKPFKAVETIKVPETDMMELVTRRDLLLHYPYQSMKPFLYLIRQAANDPNVLSIKITIYRMAKKANLVDYLCTAAENGKNVTAMIELRARFDEQNNIDWSEKLEDAGCNVFYGFDEYKCHSKVCLITYKDKGKIKYITQIGTGNYNESTAKQYTDLSLITGNQEIGEDANEFFKNMSIGSLEGNYKHFLVAPIYMKSQLLELFDEQIAKGKDGRIFFKINSLTDLDMINKLAEASQAGVQISMVIRGICCILPGIDSLTNNITIRGIVGRYLEHSRIYSFGEGDSQKMYISSADLMTRNLDRRVEVACPIYDPEIKMEVNKIIETTLLDNIKARMIDTSGKYYKLSNNKEPLISQELFIEQSLEIEPFKGTEKKSIIDMVKTLFKS